MERPTYHHGHLKQAILATALELIDAGGLESLTLRAVAKKLGVSHAAPIHHFPTRGDLLGALAEEGFERFAQALEAAVEGPEADRLLRVGRAYVAFAGAHPQYYQLLFGAELTPEAVRTPGLKRQSDRALAVLSQSAGRHALLAWAVVHGLVQLRQGPYVCATNAEREALGSDIDEALITFTTRLGPITY